MNEETIFAEARRKPSPAERDEFLRQACADNAALRERVEALLEADKARDSLLDEPLMPGSETIELRSTIEKPGDQVGDYKLLQQIGEGGFGVVFMAEQMRPVVRRVALKIIKPGMDSREVIARFEAERQALAMMDHPNIAKVLGAGTTTQGRPYFVMELVRGIRITQFCDDQQLTPRERLELFIPVCHAIQHAHQKGVIHRDIKPSNILVSLYDGRPVPKVIDFGVAKAIQQRLTEKTMFTQFGQVIGTLEYMCPEQAEMNQFDIDTRADIYSLGAVLYELLTGSPPFEHKRLRSAAFDQVLRIIREEEPPRPSMRLSASENLPTISAQRKIEPARLSRLVRGDLDWIVMKALDKQRSRRYDSASRLAADIEAHLSGLPVSAAAPSTAYRVQKYIRRHKAPLAVAATILALLLTGTIVSAVLALRERRARADESEQRIRAESNERDANEQRRRAEAGRAAAEKAQREAARLAYARAMQLAQSDWERGSLTRLEEMLDATASYPDRGFEWYYWQAQLHQQRRTIYPQLGPIAGVRRAADPREIIVDAASLSYYPSARSYRLDTVTGNVRAVYGRGPMSADGRWLVDGMRPENGTTVIDMTTGVRTSVSLPETESKIGLSPDGARLITIDYAARTSYVRDVRTSTPIHVIKPAIYDAEFSPDGQWFAGTVNLKNKSEIELRRASDGKLIRAPQSIEGRFLGFTPDSAHLARWDGATRQIRLHKTSDLSAAKQVPWELMWPQIGFSPDGDYVAIMSRDNHVVVIKEVETGRRVSTYRVNRISGIAFSHDGQELVTCSLDGAVKFFPVESGDYIQTDPHLMIQFSGDGSRLLTRTNSSSQSQLIDVASRKILTSYPNVWRAAIFPNGRRIVAASPYSDEDPSTTITIADDDGNQVDAIKYDDRVGDLEVAPDGQHIAVASPGSLVILDVETKKQTFRLRGTMPWGAFLPDGKQVANWFRGESLLRFYDLATGHQVDSLQCEPQPQAPWVQFSPDGKRVAVLFENTAASDFGVSIYDLATKERIRTITGHAGRVSAACFLPPDARRLVTKSWDGTVRLWDVENGVELLSFHDDAYNQTRQGLAVAPDGRKIAISAGEAGVEGVFLKEAATPEQVAAWQSAPKEPTDTQWWKRLGGIQDWLVLAPVHLGKQEDFAVELEKQRLPGEADLEPSAAQVTSVDGAKFSWRHIATSDCVLDLQMETSPDADHCLAYAVSHIYSDARREEVRLLVGSDDLAKFYLNGTPIYRFQGGRPAIPGDDEVRINLQKGKNVLVCKVIDIGQHWGISVQVVGEDYRPIPGVTTGIKP
jgi:serine/threonine protein kinase/WD40 repeat protein